MTEGKGSWIFQRTLSEVRRRPPQLVIGSLFARAVIGSKQRAWPKKRFYWEYSNLRTPSPPPVWKSTEIKQAKSTLSPDFIKCSPLRGDQRKFRGGDPRVSHICVKGNNCTSALFYHTLVRNLKGLASICEYSVLLCLLGLSMVSHYHL